MSSRVALLIGTPKRKSGRGVPLNSLLRGAKAAAFKI